MFRPDLTNLQTKAVVVQAVDDDGDGLAGIEVEIRRDEFGFIRRRVTGPGGFSEDLDAPLDVLEPDDRFPVPATGRSRCRNPGSSPSSATCACSSCTPSRSRDRTESRMSNKSGTSSQAISLPTGGGALSGIGETFAPDLFTGTGNLTVPIALPAGRNGFQPQLSLAYSTGNGNGPFGLGWDVPTSPRCAARPRAVSRGTATSPANRPRHVRPVRAGGPRRRRRAASRGHDVSGRAPRVCSPASSATAAAAATSGGSARRDGLVSRVRRRPATSDRAVVADPADRTRIFGWQLTETTRPVRQPDRVRVPPRHERRRPAAVGPAVPGARALRRLRARRRQTGSWSR